LGIGRGALPALSRARDVKAQVGRCGAGSGTKRGIGKMEAP
jgi:hypothetical protein